MKVKKLIDILSTMPQDMEVKHIWDGRARTIIEAVWEAKKGFVATSEFNMVVYDTKDRPTSAPTEEEVKFWYPTEESLNDR